MAALRFGLKWAAHPAVGGTPLLNLTGALPLNVTYNFETASILAGVQCQNFPFCKYINRQPVNSRRR